MLRVKTPSFYVKKNPSSDNFYFSEEKEIKSKKRNYKATILGVVTPKLSVKHNWSNITGCIISKYKQQFKK
jgi:hypothetical protein